MTRSNTWEIHREERCGIQVDASLPSLNQARQTMSYQGWSKQRYAEMIVDERRTITKSDRCWNLEYKGRIALGRQTYPGTYTGCVLIARRGSRGRIKRGALYTVFTHKMHCHGDTGLKTAYMADLRQYRCRGGTNPNQHSQQQNKTRGKGREHSRILPVVKVSYKL